MLKSICLLGSSSGRNAGDAALISGIMDAVDASCGRRLHYEVPTSRPSYISNNYPNDVRPISMMPWNGSLNMLGFPTYNSIMRSDLSLIFDNILFDRSLYNPLFNYMSTLRVILPRAIKKGAKMGFYNVGVGPFDLQHGRQMVKDLADMAAFITVRDKGSFETLRGVGVPAERMLLTADAALTVTAADKQSSQAIIREVGLFPDQEILALNVNRYIDTWARPKRPSMGLAAFIETYTRAVNKIVSELDVQVLFVATQHHDVEISEAIIKGVKSSKPVGLVSNRTYNHYEVKGVLGHVSMLFAMRLHAMILATSELTPTLGLAYQPKCDYYFENLGLQQWMLPFSKFNDALLTEHVVEGWRNRDAIKETLERKIPELKADAFKAAELVRRIDGGESVESAVVKQVQASA